MMEFIPVYGTIPAYIFTEADVNGEAIYETPSGPVIVTPRGQATVTVQDGLDDRRDPCP
jgi:hypothetical protein